MAHIDARRLSQRDLDRPIQLRCPASREKLSPASISTFFSDAIHGPTSVSTICAIGACKTSDWLLLLAQITDSSNGRKLSTPEGGFASWLPLPPAEVKAHPNFWSCRAEFPHKPNPPPQTYCWRLGLLHGVRTEVEKATRASQSQAVVESLRVPFLQSTWQESVVPLEILRETDSGRLI